MLEKDKKYFPTGNEYISIPTIREDASINSINFLHMGYRGLVEIYGEPLIKPIVLIDGEEKEVKNIEWKRIKYWIPRFKGEIGNIKIIGTILAPLGCRGFIYNLKIINSGENINFSLGLKGTWIKALHTINESKVIDGKKHIYYSTWSQEPIFDFRNGISMFSFGFVTDVNLDVEEWSDEQTKNCNIKTDSEKEIQYKLTKEIYLVKNETYEMNFYFGVGLEEVGAATSAIEMKRYGYKYLFDETTKWLNDKVKSTKDEIIDNILNLNLFFNYFYASGRTLDTEETVLVTSRSPRYYVSAAYWDRDSLLWSFPALLLINTDYAREILEYVFTKQIRNVGIHSRYIDGTVLEPGFELDELCSPILALKKYIEHTKDFSILDETYTKKGINKIISILLSKKHETVHLYETFLQPTDDMNIYPYLTYNNVLVWRVFIIVSEFYKYWNNNYEAKRYIKFAEEVKNAVFTNCVIRRNNKGIFAWAVDLNGNYVLYDEPPGSLTLLPFYGFIDKDNKIFKNTCNYIYSEEFEHYFGNSNFKELGCSHAEHPWILSVANSLVNGRKEQALDILRRTPMDTWIACESINEYTGLCETGAHFATCAGFLSYAIYHAFFL